MPRYAVTIWEPVGATVVDAETEDGARVAAFDDPTYAWIYDTLGPEIQITVEEIDEDDEIPEGDE